MFEDSDYVYNVTYGTRLNLKLIDCKCKKIKHIHIKHTYNLLPSTNR